MRCMLRILNVEILLGKLLPYKTNYRDFIHPSQYKYRISDVVKSIFYEKSGIIFVN